MTKQELIKRLEQIDGDPVIVLSRDSEGNWFDKLSDIEILMYDHNTREVGFAEITEQMQQDGYTEEDISRFGERAIVLWP